ncbi:hypothetical protein F5148DRAFT_1279648 [Russula earlei]|uniref:Uncharacterized protein n=1 Tax=Russula earlei TaxID=71964 RepID=A0ACC0ULI8_9AGAM|nr:hypothetical protein F5148DRAFT_1279648 [Russula earlei]
MEATLLAKAVHLEQQFLLAVLSDDEESLKEVFREQSQFSNHVNAIQATRKLDEKTARLPFQVAGSIQDITSCLLQSESISQDAQSHLNDLISEMPTNTSETSSPTVPYHPLFSHHPSDVQSTLGQHKALDAHAYRWLMHNLHNPYPPSKQLQVLGHLSGTSAAQVEIWFEEMRDVIGWTRLSREFFASSPGATVAAARRVYLERDNSMPFGVVSAFTAMKAVAETHFPERPALEGKHFNEDHDLSWTLPGMPEAPDHCMDSEGIFVPFQVDSSMAPDDFFYLSESDCDSSEEEDTTPPPAVAGCKRRLTEDILTSEDSDSARPKRYRFIEGALSEQEHAPSSDPLLKRNSARATASISVSPIDVPFNSSLHLTPPSYSIESSTSICHKRGRAEFDEGTLDEFVGLDDAFPPPIQRRKVLESASPMPSHPSCRPIAAKYHPSLNSLSSTGDLPSIPPPPSIIEPVTDTDIFSTPVTLDCNSVTSPSNNAAWISMPAYIDVPNSDFLKSNPQLPHFPDVDYHFTASSSSLDAWPSFGDLSGLPSSLISSSSSSSLYLETPTSQVIDWSSLPEFTPSVPPVISPHTSLSTTHRTVPNSQEGFLFPPFPPSCDIDQAMSLLDPSIPPSAFLSSSSSDAFADDLQIWPLYGVS